MPLIAEAFDTTVAATDEELLERLRGGDRSALDGLMDRHAEAVLNFIFRYVGDRAWAEDLAQETFLAVFERAETFRRGQRFTPWLFRIARNEAIDFARRRAVRRRPVPPPEEPAEPDDRAEAVQAALDALPEKFRAPLLLVDLEGLTYEEAAEALGCSAKTLSSRIARAREKLRATIREETR